MSLISQEYANYLRFEEEQRMKKKDTFCKADIRKAKEDAVGKCLTILVAALMDEYDLEREDINKVIDRFSRYSEAVDEHLITVKQVAKIIEEQTGVVVKWY